MQVKWDCSAGLNKVIKVICTWPAWEPGSEHRRVTLNILPHSLLCYLIVRPHSHLPHLEIPSWMGNSKGGFRE